MLTEKMKDVVKQHK